MKKNRCITASQAKALMTKYTNAIILDVRNEWEFTSGHIPGAILLPDYEVERKASTLLPDEYALILVYCQSGARSRSVTSLLAAMGYMNVFDFGGINAWPYGRV